jgi:hypothetical protein
MINFYQFKGNGEWEVVSTSATVETKGETQVQFSLKIRRIPTFYLINVVGPVLLLAIFAITFKLIKIYSFWSLWYFDFWPNVRPYNKYDITSLNIKWKVGDINLTFCLENFKRRPSQWTIVGYNYLSSVFTENKENSNFLFDKRGRTCTIVSHFKRFHVCLADRLWRKDELFYHCFSFIRSFPINCQLNAT